MTTQALDACPVDRCTRELRHRGRHNNRASARGPAGPSLTRRLDRHAEREADDRGSRLAHGIPDYDRWPVQL